MKRALWIGAIVALWALVAPPGQAQPERGRILRGLEMQPLRGQPGGMEVRIRTGVPVRYVRHAPHGRTDRVTIQFTPLVRNAEDLLARAGSEALHPPPGAPIALEEVRYQGSQAGDGVLELRFSERVDVEAGQGSDLRSLVVKVVPSGAQRRAAAQGDPRAPASASPAPPQPRSEPLPPVPPKPETAATARPSLPDSRERSSLSHPDLPPPSQRDGVTILLSDPEPPTRTTSPARSRPAPSELVVARRESTPTAELERPVVSPERDGTAADPEERPRVDPAPAPIADAVELSHSFALQLFAGPETADFPPLPGAQLTGFRLYAVPFEREGQAWRRLRLGFFATREEADRLRRELAPHSPDAWIVEVEMEERLASGEASVDATGLAAAPAADPAEVPPDVAPPATAPTSGVPVARTANPTPDPVVPDERPEPRPFQTESSVEQSDLPPPPSQLSPEEAEAVTRLLAEARDALSRGEHDRAVQLFTQVRGFPENEHSPEALEWLALARERKGQEAHARAEYEDYLKLYPEGEGAARVRQRLDALLTARSTPQEPLRQAAPDRAPRLFDSFGSLSTSYRRDERMTDDGGDVVVDSSVFSDVFAAARGETEAWDLRSEFAGSHVQDFLDESGEYRVNTLFVEALGRSRPWGFGFGRLPGNRSGVIGRYDGGRVSYAVSPSSRISAVAGFPVEPFVTSRLDTDQQLLGLSFEALEWWEGLDVELFAIQQWAEGLTDRTAVGAEFSYTDGVRFVAGQLDYDVHFTELNTAFVIGSWQLDPATHLNLFLDWRKLPFLATRNALFGQPEDDLDDLRDRFGTSALSGLAEDRTARSRSATLGITRQLTERLQLAADLGVSDLSGTPASGGIDSFEGTGRQIQGFVQLIATEVLRTGDVGNVGLRIVTARDVDVLGLLVGWRSPLWRKFRFNPLMDLTWRGPDRGASVITARPGLRVDYRVGPFTLDFDGRYEWSDGERFPGVEDEQGYTLLFGVRYDY